MSRTKIFFNNIPLYVKYKEIINFLKKFDVNEIPTIMYNSKEGNKCGVVQTFCSKKADKILNCHNTDIFKIKVPIKFYNFKSEKFIVRKNRHKESVKEQRSIILKGLPYILEQSDIHKIKLSAKYYGQIEDLFIIFNKGICFIDFRHKYDANNYIRNMKNLYIGNRKIYVSFTYEYENVNQTPNSFRDIPPPLPPPSNIPPPPPIANNNTQFIFRPPPPPLVLPNSIPPTPYPQTPYGGYDNGQGGHQGVMWYGQSNYMQSPIESSITSEEFKLFLEYVKLKRNN